MKARFDYNFRSDYIFIKDPIHIKYEATGEMTPRESNPNKKIILIDGSIDILINHNPDKVKNKYTGCFHITLPGRAEDVAHNDILFYF